MVPKYEIFSSAFVGVILDGSGKSLEVEKLHTFVSCHSGTELDCAGTGRSRQSFACY